MKKRSALDKIKVKDLQVVLVIIIVAIFLMSKKYLFPSDLDLIYDSLSQVSVLNKVYHKEPILIIVQKANNFGELFTDDALILYKSNGQVHGKISGRKAIVKQSISIKKQFNTLNLEFIDTMADVKNEKAYVSTTLQAEGISQNSKEKFIEAIELKIIFIKKEHQWLIHQVENIETIE